MAVALASGATSVDRAGAGRPAPSAFSALTSGNAEGGRRRPVWQTVAETIAKRRPGRIRQNCRTARGAEEKRMSVLRGLAVVLVGLLAASCVAHGQQGAKQTTVVKNNPRLFQSYSSHSAQFFDDLFAERVFIHEHASLPGVVRGEVYRRDGTLWRCYFHPEAGKHVRHTTESWHIATRAAHAARAITVKGKTGYSVPFYDAATGALRLEFFHRGAQGVQDRAWAELGAGWVQDSWPRLLADACPGVKIPPGMPINEKQTAPRIADMAEQDPSAPIRNAPGSDLTAPGRVGFIDTNWGPTTTREEVMAFMESQKGNVMLSPLGHGYVFTAGWDTLGEVWRLGEDGTLAGFGSLHLGNDKSGQDWVISKVPDLPEFHYPMGYPVPMLPTGHRHAAFQLTDRLVASGEPVVLPWMPSEWKDFTFLADGKVRARRADGGPDRISTWHWTKGRLRVQTDGNREAPDWEEVGEQLGLEKPKLWTPADGQRIGPTASAGAATSGTGRCAGAYEGVATWTLGTDGKPEWDTSACRLVQ